MKSSLANRNCAAKFYMCILYSITSAHLQFLCMGTIGKGGDGAKGSIYLLRFGAWNFLIEDKIGEVSSKGCWKEPQSENALQTAVMWDSLFVSPGSPLPVANWISVRSIFSISSIHELPIRSIDFYLTFTKLILMWVCS